MQIKEVLSIMQANELTKIAYQTLRERYNYDEELLESFTEHACFPPVLL